MVGRCNEDFRISEYSFHSVPWNGAINGFHPFSWGKKKIVAFTVVEIVGVYALDRYHVVSMTDCDIFDDICGW